MQRVNKYKPTFKIVDTDFPQLPTVNPINPNNDKTEWISKKTPESAVNTQPFDIYEGSYDENSVPIYGKIIFANGDVYRGPIFTSFPKEDIIYEHDEYNSYDSMKEYEEYEQDPYENYGEMHYANGKVFSGVFCFGKSVIKNMVKIIDIKT
jgi:hypothetical protein